MNSLDMMICSISKLEVTVGGIRLNGFITHALTLLHTFRNTLLSLSAAAIQPVFHTAVTSITIPVNEIHTAPLEGSPNVSSSIAEMKSVIKRNKDRVQ